MKDSERSHQETDECVYEALSYYKISQFQPIKRLDGYDDMNYLIKGEYVLKIIYDSGSTSKLLEIITNLMDKMHVFGCSSVSTDFVVPRLIRDRHESLWCRPDITKSKGALLLEYFNSKTLEKWLESINNEDEASKVYKRTGKMCADLTGALATVGNQGLLAELRNIRGETHPWTLLNAFKVVDVQAFEDNSSRALIVQALQECKEKFTDEMRAFLGPDCILHGDLSEKNILVSTTATFDGEHNDNRYASKKQPLLVVIDWQDIQVGPRIVELALLCLYLTLSCKLFKTLSESYDNVSGWLYAGYEIGGSKRKLTELELKALPLLMKLRLCQSLFNATIAIKGNPNNDYVRKIFERGWDMLRLLMEGGHGDGDGDGSSSIGGQK